jgi:hypothetical protein
MKARREEVVANLKRLKEECLPLLTVLEDQEKVKQLRTDKQFTFPILAEQYQARPRPAGRGAAHPDRWPPWLALLQRAGAAHTTQAPPLRHGRRRAMRSARMRRTAPFAQVTQKNVLSLYDFAKFQFECGNYAKYAE